MSNLSECDPAGLLQKFATALPALEKDFTMISGDYKVVNFIESNPMTENELVRILHIFPLH